jgi:hypothetical protein
VDQLQGPSSRAVLLPGRWPSVASERRRCRLGPHQCRPRTRRGTPARPIERAPCQNGAHG